MSQPGPGCVNIGRAGVNQRRMVGVWALFLGVILAGLLIGTQQPWWTRFLIFIPIFFGFLGLLQAQRRTCVFLGLKGQQNLDAGREDIVDPGVKKLLWFRSVRLLLAAAVFAGLVTALALYLFRPDA